MFKRYRVEWFAGLLLSGIMLPSTAIAQIDTGFSPGRHDRFSAVHQNLSDAADRRLAAVLTDRPGINVGTTPSTIRNFSSSTIDRDPVLRIQTEIHRVDQLRPTLEPILRAEGVPIELSAVVLVESGGLTTALSPKGARGVWQIMPDTARRYGLVVDGTRDDRTDVVKSTRAATHYLKDLYRRFGDWSLALAAYNGGEQAVANALNQAGSRDFVSISNAGLLPLETRNYVPAVSAAISRLHYGNPGKLVRREGNDAFVIYAYSSQ